VTAMRESCRGPKRSSRRLGLPGLSPFLCALAAAIALLAAGCSASPRPARPLAPAAAGFTILQINDTYKIEGLRAGAEGGMSRVRTLRRQLEGEGRPVLVLHAGDFIFPSVMSKYLAGAPMIDALNLLDGGPAFDPLLFVVPGNHEFDNPDPQVLYDRIAQSSFGWISSNVRVAAGAQAAATDPAGFRPLSARFPNVSDHRVVELGGIRVGIFGLTLDDQRRPWIDYGYDVETRRATLSRVLDELDAEGAEFVVALTHQELGEDEWLAREYGDRIDWIVGGHEHVAQRRSIGSTTITKADADAKSAYRIDVRRAGNGGEEWAATASLVPLDATVPVDPDMVGEVASSLVTLERTVAEKTGRRLLEVVATTEHLLEGTEPAIRGRETALGDLLCDILRERFDVDLAFVNGGAIRVNDDVPAGGDLRVYELEGIFYYDDKPVLLELTGRDLLGLLEKSVSQAALGHGRFLQVAGVRFTYATNSDGTARVFPADVTIRLAGTDRFVPLELERRYRAATLDYIWRNGYRDGYPLFSAGAGEGGTSPTLLERPEVSWRALTEEALAALPGRRITTDVDGRIRPAPGPQE
jgi:2',3'-cyclic-nucleotide 2'-phosphodiesterase (5'-nucleotidase family)